MVLHALSDETWSARVPRAAPGVPPGALRCTWRAGVPPAVPESRTSVTRARLSRAPGDGRPHLGALLLALCATAAAAPTLTIEPAEAPTDAEFIVRVEGLPPCARVELRCSETDARGQRWEARAVLHGDTAGVLDNRVAAAVEGTYAGVDPSGLLWSMLPAGAATAADHRRALVADPRLPRRPAAAAPLAPRRGVVELRDDAGAVLASAGWIRHRLSPDVTRTPVAAGALRGEWFAPPAGHASRTAVVVLGGSFGGLELDHPALLASRGHPSLALAFFKHLDLPDTGDLVPLEYFAEALRWTRTRPGVDRVVLLGHSRGGEAALLVASLFPELLDGAIALAPSHLVNNGEGRAWGDWLWTEESMWSFGGEPVPFAPYVPTQTPEVAAYRERSRLTLEGYAVTGEYRTIWLDPANARFAIPVERATRPLLLVAGAADEIWPAAFAIEQVRRRAPHAQTLLLPGAGHALGTPGEVTSFAASVRVGQSFEGWVALGGEPSAEAAGARAAWRACLEFLATIGP